MGFSPVQVGEMSLWQFFACADGYAQANSPEAAKLSNDEAGDVAKALFDAAPDFLPQ